MFSIVQRKAVVLLVLPAVLAFGMLSTLEVFHPVEEAPLQVAPHNHVEVGDGVSLHDSSHSDLRDHEHHYCAHSNALSHLARLDTSVQRVQTFAKLASDTETAVVRSLLLVHDRGPPLL